ncbi:hypothetical protein M8J76_006861 [Diaphorina citri]|nr:hypothetical protein M8J76_006861 [Diaphorina citri]
MVSFVGYNLIRNDRLHKGRGGVAIYLRGDFEYSIAAMSNGNVEGSMEYIFLEIRINNSKLLLGVVYRPPRRSFVEFLTEYENILADFVPVYSNILIQGDFNCNLLNDTSESSSFHSLIDTLCLEVLPTGATFHLPSGYSSLLDLSMTSSSNKIKLHGSLSTPGFTNHDLLYVVYDLRCSKSRNLLITYRDYKHLNLEELLRTLSEVNWDVKIYQVQSVNDKVTSFCEIISELYDKFVPVKQSRVKRRPAPWLTDELKRKMNARDRAHAQYRRTKSPLDWEKYRKLRNGCTHACRDARRGHIVEYISEGSPDNIWPLLKGMGVGPDQHSSDNSSNSVDLNGLNSHFTTNPAQVNGDVKTRTLQQIQSLPKPDCPSFDFRDVTSSEVSTALSAIKSNATGDFVSAVRLLNDDLEYIRIWTGAHGILPNPNKFQAIVVGSEKRLPRVDLTTGQLSFNGTTIPYSNNVKNLGVIIDSTLSWESHINNVTKKCFFSFHSLNLLRRILPFNVRKLVCSTLILPIIEYADNVYIGMTKELQTKVQRLQNTCVRYIFGLRKYDHVSMCRASLGWLTMDQRREIHVSTLLWRVLNTRTPSYLASMFTPLALHAHDTRSGDEALLMIPVHRTEFFARSFSVQAAKLWNSLPRKLRTCDNQKVFRRLILEHYTD